MWTKLLSSWVPLTPPLLLAARYKHRLFARDLSLCWHDTALVSNAVQKVKAEIVRLFDTLGQRPEWAAGQA
nr:hypothetical protein [Burkholderia cepacia]